jgi:hypothetical protein
MIDAIEFSKKIAKRYIFKKKQVESLSEGKGASYDAKGTKVHKCLLQSELSCMAMCLKMKCVRVHRDIYTYR